MSDPVSPHRVTVANRNRMPLRRSKHVVLIHSVARLLGWSTARVRSVDGILRPMRRADGTRIYGIHRVRYFVHAIDSAPQHLG